MEHLLYFGMNDIVKGQEVTAGELCGLNGGVVWTGVEDKSQQMDHSQQMTWTAG